MTSSTIYIYGIHPVREALVHRPETVRRVFFADNFDGQQLRSLAKEGVDVESFQPDAPPHSVSQQDAHQGVVAEINTDTLTDNRDEFIASLADEPGMNVAILGELQDPQNVGAIIRSSAAFGFGAVLIPQRRQTQITPAVVKVSAGTAFRIRLVSIGNVNNTIEKLKRAGFWVYGLSEDGSENIADQEFAHDSAVVVGNEGDGLRTKTAEHCDKLVRIPADSEIPLNAAAAAAVGFYAVSAS